MLSNILKINNIVMRQSRSMYPDCLDSSRVDSVITGNRYYSRHKCPGNPNCPYSTWKAYTFLKTKIERVKRTMYSSTSLQGQYRGMKIYTLLAHAFSGCGRTSAIYGTGKEAIGVLEFLNNSDLVIENCFQMNFNRLQICTANLA